MAARSIPNDPQHRQRWASIGLLAALAALAGAPAMGQDCAWQPAHDAPLGRLEAPAIVVDGRMLVVGGFGTDLIGSDRLDAYDPTADTWIPLADLPFALTHFGLARDDRHLWLAGGFAGDHPGPVVASVMTYDIDLDRWSPAPSLPAPRGSGGLFRIGRSLHWVGGVGPDRNTDHDDHWILNLDAPGTGWQNGPPLPIARNHFAVATLAGRAYLIGGQFRHDVAPQDVAFVHMYDPASGWTQLADLPFPRSHFEPGTYVDGQRIVIAGGRANTLGMEAVADVSAYDTLANTWTPLAPLPGPLLAPAAQRVGSEMLVAGGAAITIAPTQAAWRRPADGGLPPHLRINCGGPSLTLAEAWCPDFGALQGQAFANPGVGDIGGTDQDELYTTERTGSNASPQSFGYRIALPNGDYRVRLHFAEIFWGAPGGSALGTDPVGKRVFDVLLEGQVVLDDFDIAAAVGPAQAVMREFDLALVDGELTLDLVASVDRPKLSGLEVIRLSQSGGYCPANPNSGGLPAELVWGGTTSVAANDFTLAASNTPPSSAGLFLQAPTQTQLTIGAGKLCVGPAFFRLLPLVYSDPAGNVTRTLDLANPHLPAAGITAGSSWNFQLYFRDSALGTSNFTNGVAVSFAP